MAISIERYTDYRPGVIGRIVALHATYYHAHWGFGIYFEAKVARELADFLEQLDPLHDGLWIAHDDDQIIGAIAIVADGQETRRLRWFIVDPAYQGHRLGDQLITQALRFCEQTGVARIYLTTFAGLDAARRLYERNGFHLSTEHDDSSWGHVVREQTFEWVSE